jgi:hypothetical protein
VFKWKIRKLLKLKKFTFPKSGQSRLLFMNRVAVMPHNVYDDDYCILIETPDKIQINYTASDKGMWKSHYTFPYKLNTTAIRYAIYACSIPRSIPHPRDFGNFVIDLGEGFEERVMPNYIYVDWNYDNIISINGIDVN